jgi:hypothetical protein
MAGPVMVRLRVASIVAGGVLCLAGRARAQRSDSTRCDSIVFASRRDSVKTSIYISAKTIDFETTKEYRQMMATAVGTNFTVPRPFRLSVFSGPVQMRGFRRMGADTATELRAPTVTGIYRFRVTPGDSLLRREIFRASLVPGLDSAMLEAIRQAVAMKGIFDPPPGMASMRVEVRIATDSEPNAIRVIDATFPRMPVIDAKPRTDNRVPKLPFDVMENDSTRRHDVLLRFVVDRTGLPALETIEVLRGGLEWVLREAFNALPGQRFTPATIAGCPVAQLVEYPFTFAAPPRPPMRH